MLRRVLLAGAGVMALSGVALAQGTGAQPPWTGFYAGLNAGYSFAGGNSANVTTVPTSLGTGAFNAGFGAAAAASATGVLSLNNAGFIGGGQAGYNYQFANAWVVGIETDIQGTGARDSATFTGPAVSLAGGAEAALSQVFVSNAVDYLGTLRGRIGFVARPTLLVFASGGLAYGHVHQDVNVFSQTTASLFPAGPGFGTLSRMRAGWTVGGGADWRFAPNWSLRGEYLYYDLGRTTLAVPFARLNVATSFTDVTSVTTRWNGNIARVALSFHFN